MTASTNNTFTKGYWPNTRYVLCGGVRVKEFVSPNCYAEAIPYDEGFFNDPDAKAQSIGVVNLCGEPVQIALDTKKTLNPKRPPSRENQREADTLALNHGCSFHFNMPPCGFNVSITQFELSDNGVRRDISQIGLPLVRMDRKIVSITDTPTDGLVHAMEDNTNTAEYCLVKNNTDHDIRVTISKSSTAYSRTPEQLVALRMDRGIDYGAELVESTVIKMGGVWHVKRQRYIYTLRILETEQCRQTQGTTTMGQLGRSSQLSSKEDYVEICNCDVYVGKIAVILKDDSNQQIVVIPYDCNALKLVSPTMVSILGAPM